MLGRLTLFTSVVTGIGVEVCERNAEAIYAATTTAIGSHSKAVAHAAISPHLRLLSRLAVSRPQYHLVATPAIPGSLDEAVAEWVPLHYCGRAALRLPWTTPTRASTATARALAERGVSDAASEVRAMVADGSIADSGHAARRRLRRAQLLGYACVSAVLSVMPGVTLTAEAIERRGCDGDSSVALFDVTAPGWEGCTIAEQLLESALLVATHVDPVNVYALSLVMSAVEVRRCAA